MPLPRPTSPSNPAAPTKPAAPPHGADPSARTGTDATRRFFAHPASARPLTLWGSSSMSSEGGAEGTPIAVRIHEHLALANAPSAVHAFGVGATRSPHTLLLRGIARPQLIPAPAQAGRPGAVAVTLDSGLAPAGPIRCTGDIDGLPGELDGRTGTWVFTPSDPHAVVVPGRFTSSLGSTFSGARQVLWMGKNNILQVENVLADIDAMVQAAPDPQHDTLVLGHWATHNDPVGSAHGDALRTVNQQLARRYGDYFLGIEDVLTTENALCCAPIAPLRILEQGPTHDALSRGIVPPALIASDGIHLNGWGNLAVCAAIVNRMRELRWL